jgi:hypothetical protein
MTWPFSVVRLQLHLPQKRTGAVLPCHQGDLLGSLRHSVHHARGFQALGFGVLLADVFFLAVVSGGGPAARPPDAQLEADSSFMAGW